MKDTLIKLSMQPEYLIKDKAYISFIKKIKVRLIIFVILLLLILISYFLGSKFIIDSSLAENLIAGFISSIITIFIIDFLFNYDKKIKIQEINLYNNDRFLLKLRGLMCGFLYAFGEISKKEYKDLLFGVPDDKFKKFTGQIKQNKKILGFATYSIENVKILELLAEIEEDYSVEIRELISKFVPYPDPILKRRITYDGSWFSAWLELHKILFFERFHNFGEKKPNVSKGTLPRRLASVSNEEAYKIITNFPEDLTLFQNNFLKYCNMIVDLLERSRKQEIPFSI